MKKMVYHPIWVNPRRFLTRFIDNPNDGQTKPSPNRLQAGSECGVSKEDQCICDFLRRCVSDAGDVLVHVGKSIRR